MQGLTRAVIVAAVLAQVRPADAVTRLIAEPTGPVPQPSSSLEVLFVRHDAVAIGPCPDTPDAAVPAAGVPDAAPSLASPDAPAPDAALDGPPGCDQVPVPAVTMVVQPRFGIGAEGARFALLFVTPTNPVVEVEAHDLFARLADVTAPEIEIEEIRVEDPALGTACDAGGCGNWDSDLPPSWDPPPVDGTETPPIETVGPYEIARLQPTDAATVATWLDGLGYTYSTTDVAAVMPYRALGYTVVAVRVVATAALDGGLEPIALTYPGTEIRIPIGLAHTDAPSSLALTVYIAADGRFDVPDADVSFARSTSWGDADFLTRNDMIVDLGSEAAADPIAAHVPGDPTYWTTVTVPRMVRVPVSDCGFDLDLGCCRIGGRGSSPATFALTLIALAFVIRPRRRRRTR